MRCRQVKHCAGLYTVIRGRMCCMDTGGQSKDEGPPPVSADRVRPETANAGDLDTIRRLGEGRKMCPELQKTFVPMRRRVTLQYGRGRDVGRWAQTKASAPPSTGGSRYRLSGCPRIFKGHSSAVCFCAG